MSEHKKSHIATVMTLFLFAVIAVALYEPVAFYFIAAALSVVSVPIVIWNCFRSVF